MNRNLTSFKMAGLTLCKGQESMDHRCEKSCGSMIPSLGDLEGGVTIGEGKRAVT